jgi:hypothetical protein
VRFALATLLIGCTAGDDLPAPLISTVTPTHGQPGSSIELRGDYLCQQQELEEADPLACENVGTVVFDQTTSTPGSYTEHEVTAEVPGLEPGSHRIIVQVAGRHSNALSFTIDSF